MVLSEQIRHVKSGDVDILVRHFGAPGLTPLVILHGANYHDSLDWRDVAAALSFDREVAVYDARGFGGSGWSSSKDYSHDANVGDLLAVIDDLDWKRAVFVGAARGAAFATIAASCFPERAAGLSLIDWIPNIGIRHPGAPLKTEQSVGNAKRRFATIEDALRATTRSPATLSTSAGRARFEALLELEEQFYVLAVRDPDFQNPIPLTETEWIAHIPIDVDLWEALHQVTCPTQYVQAMKSNIGIRLEDRARLKCEFDSMHWGSIDAGNDLVFEAAGDLVRLIQQFLGRAVDPVSG